MTIKNSIMKISNKQKNIVTSYSKTVKYVKISAPLLGSILEYFGMMFISYARIFAFTSVVMIHFYTEV